MNSWGNKKNNAPTREDTKHTLRKRKRGKRKRKARKTNHNKESIPKLKETITP